MPSSTIANWTKMTVSVGGAANVEVAPAENHPNAVQTVGLNVPFHYVFLASDFSPLETGLGQLTSSTTFSRIEVYETFAGGIFDNTAPAFLDIPVGAILISPPTKQLMADIFKSELDARLVGKVLVAYVPAQAMNPQLSNGCGALLQDESAAHKVVSIVLPFDAAVVENAQFSFIVPKGLSRDLGFVVKLEWKEAAGGTSHLVKWGVAMQAQSDADAVDSSFSVDTYIADTGTTAGRHVTPESTAIIPAGDWTAGDTIICRINRQALDSVLDTLNVDAHLIGAVVYGFNSSLLEG